MDGAAAVAAEDTDVGCGWIVENHQPHLGRRSQSTSETIDAEVGLPLGGSEWRHRRKDVLSLVRRERQQKGLQATTIVCIGDDPALDDDEDVDGPKVISFRSMTDLLIHNHTSSSNDRDRVQTKFNDRTSLLSTDDETAVIQLCLADRNRKENGVFDANFDDVLTAKGLITRIRLKRFVNDQKLEPARVDQEPCNQPATLMDAMFESHDISKDDVNNQRADQLVIDYEAYLARCNVIDTVQLLSLMPGSKLGFALAKSDLVVLQVPVDGIQKMMLDLFLADKPTFKVSSTSVALDNDQSASNPESTSADIELKAEKCLLREVLLSQEAGGSNRHDGNEMTVAAQLHVEKIVVAYLRLLLNTRDEIALTIALGSMTNGFSHQAFTALRKLSASTGSLSMYQTALSFVLKVRLGGLSYAPDSSCPVMQYLPELSTFTTVMNKLQIALEEATNSLNAFKRILTVLKLHLSKTCNAKLKQDILQKALQNVELCAHRAIKNAQRPSLMCNAKSTGAVQQENISELRHLVNLHATEISLRNSSSKVWTLDTFSSQNSPIRFPFLLSQFKSPLSDAITPTKPPKDESGNLREKMNSLAPSIIRSEVMTSDSCKLSPRPSSVQTGRIATPKADDNKKNSSPIRKETSMVKKPTKRCLINDVLCPATMSKRSKGSVKSKPVRKTSKPVPKGQQLMTQFLRA